MVGPFRDSRRSEWLGQRRKGLRVSLVGHAQKAVKSLSAEDRADYAKAKEQLTKRFEPESKCALYEAEFQARKKQPVEDWATFGEDLKFLADKALDDVTLTVSNFLGQLDQQLAFSVCQRKPKTIADAVTVALELESYRLAPSHPSPASNSLPEPSFIDTVQTKHPASEGNTEATNTTPTIAANLPVLPVSPAAAYRVQASAGPAEAILSWSDQKGCGTRHAHA